MNNLLLRVNACRSQAHGADSLAPWLAARSRVPKGLGQGKSNGAKTAQAQHGGLAHPPSLARAPAGCSKRGWVLACAFALSGADSTCQGPGLAPGTQQWPGPAPWLAAFLSQLHKPGWRTQAYRASGRSKNPWACLPPTQPVTVDQRAMNAMPCHAIGTGAVPGSARPPRWHGTDGVLGHRWLVSKHQANGCQVCGGMPQGGSTRRAAKRQRGGRFSGVLCQAGTRTSVPPGAPLRSTSASASTRARAWPFNGNWRVPSTSHRAPPQRKWQVLRSACPGC